MTNLKQRIYPFPNRVEGRGTLAWWFLGNLEPRKHKVDALVVVGSYVYTAWVTYRAVQNARLSYTTLRVVRETDRALDNSYEEMGPSGEYGWRDGDVAVDRDLYPDDYVTEALITTVELVTRPGVPRDDDEYPRYDLVYETDDAEGGRLATLSQREADAINENGLIGMELSTGRRVLADLLSAVDPKREPTF